MQKPSSVGEKRTCPDCDVEVVGKEQTSTYQGKTTTKVRWANLDGSWHITKDSDGFKHQSSSSQVQGGSDTEKKSKSVVGATEEQMTKYAVVLEMEDDFHALAITQVKKHGGDATRGDVVQSKESKLIDLAKLYRMSAEIGEVAYSSQVLNGGNGVSSKGSFHTSSAVKDIDRSRQVATLPNPLFFSEQISGLPTNIIVVAVKCKCTIHGVICNETTHECKQCKEEYMDNQFAIGGTIDRGLLL